MRIIVEGNIGSGKSTVLAALGEAFPGSLVRVEPVHEWADELELFYKDPAKWALPLTLRVLLSHHKSAQNPKTTTFLERCPLSCRHVFTQLLFNEGTMPQHHWDLFREYYDVLGWEPGAGDLIVYIDTPVEKCMERVMQRARPGEDPVDVQYLRRIEFQYANMLKYCACPVVRVDGGQDQAAVRAAVVSAVTNAFSSRLLL